MPSELDGCVAALRAAFATQRDKYAAHERSRAILQDMAMAPGVLASVLERYLSSPDALSRRNYPVVAVPIDTNSHFELVANCWIPLPGGDTDLSTKAVHHHGEMILTTVTAFGPGYEHWLFTTPELVDPVDDVYAMHLLERAPHPLGHAGFVDANIPHVPFFPPSLSITFALWSTRNPVTWKDSVKRMPALHKHSTALRRASSLFGLAKMLDLKIIRYYDYFPSPKGFRGMKDRIEFGLGPNEDHLYSLFHVLQRTGNEALARVVRKRLDVASLANGNIVTQLLDQLERGRPIEGRLSAGHYDLPHANFRSEDLLHALAVCARLASATANVATA